MTSLEQQLQFLCFYNLLINCPILSGSMKKHVELGFDGNNLQIVIDAPFYDMKQWKKTGQIIYTGAVKNGFTAYAYWVNEVGAFGRHNKSEHWVNRALNEACLIMANQIGAVVINGLPL